MYVVVEHEISDPESFWKNAQEGASNLPDNLTLHQVLPNKGGKKAVCLWEADSEQAVRDFVEPSVGSASRNSYFAVEAENAVGLPAAAAT